MNRRNVETLFMTAIQFQMLDLLKQRRVITGSSAVMIRGSPSCNLSRIYSQFKHQAPTAQSGSTGGLPAYTHMLGLPELYVPRVFW